MIDHSGHPHPSTPKARALCRANGGTGDITPRKTKAAPKTRSARSKSVLNVTTGKVITQKEAADIMFGTQKVKAPTKKAPAKKRAPRLTEARVPTVDVTKSSEVKSLRSDPAYVRDYNRGWRAGAGRNDLTRADARGESSGYYDGFSDRSIGMPKWTRTEERDALAREVAATAAIEVPRNDQIDKSVASGIKSEKIIAGGVIANTAIIEFNDGSKGIRKIAFDPPPGFIEDLSRSDPAALERVQFAKDQQDAEELGSMVARMIGLDAPEVHRANDRTVLMTFKKGKPGIALSGPKRSGAIRRNDDDAYRISLLDQVIVNSDRNDGNYIVSGNRIVPIDHGFAWDARIVSGGENKAVVGTDNFSPRITSSVRQNGQYINRFKDNDVHPDDVEHMRTALNALRPEFEKRDRMKWWNFSMGQINALKPFAKGTKRRLS